MDIVPESSSLPSPLTSSAAAISAPPPPPPPIPFPSIVQAIGLTILLLFAQLVVGLVTGIANQGRSPGAWAIAVGNLVSFAIVVALGASWGKISIGRFIPLRSIPFLLAIPMMLTVLGASAITSDAANLVMWLLPPPEFVKELFSDVLGGRSSPLLSLFLLVIVAPVTEEVLFRGMLLRGMLQRYKPWKAICVTSALFAFTHLNPWQFPVAMMLGMVFGWWFYRTRSLWPCLIGHAMNNFLPALFAAIPGFQITGYTTSEGGDFQPLWFDLTGLVIMLLGIAWTMRVFARMPPPVLARAVSAIPAAEAAGTPSSVESEHTLPNLNE